LENDLQHKIRLRDVDKLFSKGFTLLETLIILLLLGIVSTVAWPSMNSALNDYRLSGAAHEVSNALELAHMTSMNSGPRTRVTINDTLDTILVEKFKGSADFTQSIISETDIEGGVYVPMDNPFNKGTNYHITLSNENRFNGVDIVSAAFSGADFVLFDAMGIPSSGGTVILTSGGIQAVVTLEALNGKVTVSQ